MGWIEIYRIECYLILNSIELIDAMPSGVTDVYNIIVNFRPGSVSYFAISPITFRSHSDSIGIIMYLCTSIDTYDDEVLAKLKGTVL